VERASLPDTVTILTTLDDSPFALDAVSALVAGRDAGAPLVEGSPR
jgi:hypothetical protein